MNQPTKNEQIICLSVKEFKASLKSGKIKIDRKKNHNESKLQIACVRWFRFQYPQYAMLLFAIPNGGWRTGIEPQIMVGEGVTPGVADLFLAISQPYNPPRKRGYFGLFIEMKVGKNKQTDTQREFQKAVEQSGYAYWVVRSFDDFVTIVNEYLE